MGGTFALTKGEYWTWTETYFQVTCDYLQDPTYSHCAWEAGHVCGNPKTFSVPGAARKETSRSDTELI